MSETLFASSTVRLFGQEFMGLSLGAEGLKGAPAILRAVQKQKEERNGGAALEPTLARIYGFSYLGSYYKLAEPTVLLVFGKGKDVPASTDPVKLGKVGVELKAETFSGEVKVWEQDRADYTLRIDITPGWLADVLIEPGMSDGTNMTTGQGPETGSRNQQVGRAALVGRAGCMIGRGNSC